MQKCWGGVERDMGETWGETQQLVISSLLPAIVFVWSPDEI